MESTAHRDMTEQSTRAATDDTPDTPLSLTPETTEKPKRKAPERFGPVTTNDLEKLQIRVSLLRDFQQDPPEMMNEIGFILRDLDKLVLRSKMAESEARKRRRAEKPHPADNL